MKPKFQHDCKACYFIRNVNGYDVYTCNGSIIARYGNDGPDYVSMPVEMFVRMWKENETIHGCGGDIGFREYATDCALHYGAIARVLNLRNG